MRPEMQRWHGTQTKHSQRRGHGRQRNRRTRRHCGRRRAPSSNGLMPTGRGSSWDSEQCRSITSAHRRSVATEGALAVARIGEYERSDGRRCE